jgi:endonuclease YncB( thermonuclease family)
MRQAVMALLAAIVATASCIVATADSVRRSDIYVVDGDTIEALGKRIRLVGFDAPELGHHAHCGLSGCSPRAPRRSFAR